MSYIVNSVSFDLSFIMNLTVPLTHGKKCDDKLQDGDHLQMFHDLGSCQPGDGRQVM